MKNFTLYLRAAAEQFSQLRGLRGPKIDEIEEAMIVGAGIAVDALKEEVKHVREDLEEQRGRNLPPAHEPRNEIRFEKPN